MNWSYRLFDDEKGTRIVEMYYDEQGRPAGYAVDNEIDIEFCEHVWPTVERRVEDIRWMLAEMTKACDLPVLTAADLTGRLNDLEELAINLDAVIDGSANVIANDMTDAELMAFFTERFR